MFSFFKKTNLINKIVNRNIKYLILSFNKNEKFDIDENEIRFIFEYEINKSLKLLKKELYEDFFTSIFGIQTFYESYYNNPDLQKIKCKRLVFSVIPFKTEVVFKNINCEILYLFTNNLEKIIFKENVNFKKLSITTYDQIKEISSDNIIECEFETIPKRNYDNIVFNNIKINENIL